MVLALAAGFALERFAGWPNALPIALVAGLVAAMFVPRRGG